MNRHNTCQHAGSAKIPPARHTPARAGVPGDSPPAGTLLRAAEEWRITVDAMRDAVCLIDPAGGILRCNLAMRQMVNEPFERLLGRSCWEIVYGQRAPPNGCVLDPDHPSESKPWSETRQIGNRWYRIAIEPIYSDTENLLGAVHVMADISDTRRAEAEVRRYSHRLRILHDIDQAIQELRRPRDIVRDALTRLRNEMDLVVVSVTLFSASYRRAEIFVAVDHGLEPPAGRYVTPDPEWVASLRRGKACPVLDVRLLLPDDQAPRTFAQAGIAATHSEPLSVANRLIGALNLGMRRPTQLSRDDTAMVRAVAVSLAVSLHNARLFESVSRQRQQLHELGIRLMHVEECLRQRLARELHDRVGQTLTALGINLNHVRDLIQGRPPRAVERLDQALIGIEATRQIRERSPETRVVILSMHATSEHIYQALQAGATGYLLKDSAGGEVLQAVHAVTRGERYLSKRIAETMLEDYIRRRRPPEKSPFERLSAREREVLQLVVEGKTSVEIGAAIHLSPKTVDSYRSRLMQKLDIHDVPGLVRFAIAHGLTPSE